MLGELPVRMDHRWRPYLTPLSYNLPIDPDGTIGVACEWRKFKNDQGSTESSLENRFMNERVVRNESITETTMLSQREKTSWEGEWIYWEDDKAVLFIFKCSFSKYKVLTFG